MPVGSALQGLEHRDIEPPLQPQALASALRAETRPRGIGAPFQRACASSFAPSCHREEP